MSKFFEIFKFVSDKKAIYQGSHHSPGPSSVVGTPPLPSARKITPKVGPNGRMMVKSYSQDASSNMAVIASAVVTTTSSSTQNVSMAAPIIASSVSDTQISQVTSMGTTVLTSKPPLPQSSNSSSVASITNPPPVKSETLSTSASTNSLRPPTVEEESYSAASDSGSLASELDASGKKEKKKRSFFNFRKKKEKIP